MRAIKFRAWDKVDHQVYKDNPDLPRMYYFANPFISDEGHVQFDSVGAVPIGDHDQARFVLMQFTGLTGKGGQEIYEGDILKVDWGDYIPDDFASRFVMEFRSYGWFPFTHAVPKPDDIEVLGNYLENPELLK